MNIKYLKRRIPSKRAKPHNMTWDLILKNLKYLRKNFCITIPIIIIVLIINIIITNMFDLNDREFLFGVLSGVLFASLLCLSICYSVRKYIVYENLLTNQSDYDKFKTCLSKNTLGITITCLIVLFLTSLLLFFYEPTQIIIEPKNINESIFLENSSVKTISIKNMGADLIDMEVSMKGLTQSWFSLNKKSFKMLKNGDTEFIVFKITVPENETVGDYRGEIRIEAKVHGKKISEVIPVIIQVKSFESGRV